MNFSESGYRNLEFKKIPLPSPHIIDRKIIRTPHSRLLLPKNILFCLLIIKSPCDNSFFFLTLFNFFLLNVSTTPSLNLRARVHTLRIGKLLERCRRRDSNHADDGKHDRPGSAHEQQLMVEQVQLEFLDFIFEK